MFTITHLTQKSRRLVAARNATVDGEIGVPASYFTRESWNIGEKWLYRVNGSCLHLHECQQLKSLSKLV